MKTLISAVFLFCIAGAVVADFDFEKKEEPVKVFSYPSYYYPSYSPYSPYKYVVPASSPYYKSITSYTGYTPYTSYTGYTPYGGGYYYAAPYSPYKYVAPPAAVASPYVIPLK